METLNKFVGTLTASLLLVTGGLHASLIYNLDYAIARYPSGDPTGPIAGPYATATFEDIGLNSVQLTLATPDIAANQTITAWFFNYSGDSSTLTINQSGGVGVDFTSQSQDTLFINDESYNFNILFGYVPNTFTFNGETSVFNITGSGLQASDFIALGNDNSQFHTIAVVRQGERAIYLANTPAVAAPEPATYLSLASLLILGAGVARRKMHARSTVRG